MTELDLPIQNTIDKVLELERKNKAMDNLCPANYKKNHVNS